MPKRYTFWAHWLPKPTAKRIGATLRAISASVIVAAILPITHLTTVSARVIFTCIGILLFAVAEMASRYGEKTKGDRDARNTE